MLRRFGALLLCAAAGLAEAQSNPFPRPDAGPPLNGKSGIQPRSDAGAYPARDSTSGVSMGAAVLTRAQIRHIFGHGLKGQFIVVEIGIYPESLIAVSPDQFRMRVGTDPGVLRPTDAADVAEAVLGKKAQAQTQPQIASPITVYNTATIGYERGPYGRGGVYAGGGTTVAVGNDPQAPSPPSGVTIPSAPDLERYLIERELPDTRTSTPVAGYLYFRRPATHQRDPNYGITWYGPIAQLHVSVLTTR